MQRALKHMQMPAASSIWPKLHSVAWHNFVPQEATLSARLRGRSGDGASTAPPLTHIQHMSFGVLTLEYPWQHLYCLYGSTHAFLEWEHHTGTKLKGEAGCSLRLESTPFPTSQSSHETTEVKWCPTVTRT